MILANILLKVNASFIIFIFRNDINFVISIEDTLQHFTEFMNTNNYDFYPMPAIKRRIIHELCVHYGCTSLSYGTDPERFVRVTAGERCVYIYYIGYNNHAGMIIIACMF